jgi:hypothetical protein
MPEGWQEVDAHGQSCHSWRELEERRIPAMTTGTALALLTLLLGLALGGALLWAVAHLVAGDGYGSRSPRPSDDWSRGTLLERGRRA